MGKTMIVCGIAMIVCGAILFTRPSNDMWWLMPLGALNVIGGVSVLRRPATRGVRKSDEGGDLQ